MESKNLRVADDKNAMENLGMSAAIYDMQRRITAKQAGKEDMFRDAMYANSRRMMEVMTFDEQMKIGYTPIIINHIAWKYAFMMRDEAAKEKLQDFKHIGRAIKTVYDEYIRRLRLDLDAAHLTQVMKETDRIHSMCTWDFTTLFYSVNNDVKKRYPEYRYDVLRTYGVIVLICIRVLRNHLREMDRIIKERMGTRDEHTLVHPCIAALEDLVHLEGGELIIDNNIDLAMKIFKKNLDKISWVV